MSGEKNHCSLLGIRGVGGQESYNTNKKTFLTDKKVLGNFNQTR